MAASPNLIPIEQWVGSDGELYQPTGEAYDPLAIPSWLGRTSLEWLQDNASRFDVTLLYNLQGTAADLGAPGEFEALAASADIFGDQYDAQGYVEGQDESYRERRYDALTTGTRIFSTLESKNETAQYAKTAITAALTSYANDPEVALAEATTTYAEQRGRLVRTAALMLTMNASDWIALEGMAVTIKQAGEGNYHALLSLSPLQRDVSRKAERILGLRVRSITTNEEQWPNAVATQSALLQTILATGSI